MSEYRDSTKEEKLNHLVSKLEGGEYKEARKFADSLLEEGFEEYQINGKCYDYFFRLVREDHKKAKKLARIFSDYNWVCWLEAE